ncbi:FecR family protein [Zunongwangia sp. HGR-M22]|uniref:FecR family protein n=1 Tax=Zunongwangia sp. HGR-M22 TaxID=3015168 RepID=UPI0022DDBA29|nr:FecR domain-containing protein [Zunongwangia sp. HGR-M22]WBL25031.1 DUF4974 domain-containing protein [Zunongwangia sp. HGR-M22]
MKELEYLIERYIDGKITSKELEELNRLLEHAGNKDHFKKMAGLSYELNLERTRRSSNKDAVLKNIKQATTPVKSINFRSYLSIAAVLIVALCATLFFFFQKKAVSEEEQYVTIEMEDGAKEVLKNTDFQIKTEADEIIVQQKGDTIKYSALANTIAISQNTLKVPKGKKMVVELADGSIVHLNSNSKLYYPTGFKSNQDREVRLEGEAYFDVFHDESRPFIVHGEQLDVEVLGTSFNFSSYNNNSYAFAVLIEGKVAVERQREATVYLEPGMMASYSKKSKTLKTSEVDTDVYTAWMDGRLVFEERSFEDIANTLERKFDIQVKFEDEKLKHERFTAKFENESIEKILGSFKQSYDFEYVINDTNVIIR